MLRLNAKAAQMLVVHWRPSDSPLGLGDSKILKKHMCCYNSLNSNILAHVKELECGLHRIYIVVFRICIA